MAGAETSPPGEVTDVIDAGTNDALFAFSVPIKGFQKKFGVNISKVRQKPRHGQVQTCKGAVGKLIVFQTSTKCEFLTIGNVFRTAIAVDQPVSEIMPGGKRKGAYDQLRMLKILVVVFRHLRPFRKPLSIVPSGDDPPAPVPEFFVSKIHGERLAQPKVLVAVGGL